MSRIISHLNTARDVIETYKGEMPLAAYLKNFFSQNRKYGSKDRKSISALCYSYYRLGHAADETSTEDRIILAVFLCENKPHALLEERKPKWNEQVSVPLNRKLLIVPGFYVVHIFPFIHELSTGMEAAAFALSFLVQPRLYIRLRPGNEQQVQDKLSTALIPFEQLSKDCIAMENGTRLEDVLTLNREYVIQDLNSQRVGAFLKRVYHLKGLTVWDCCAASGGKSILAFDILGHINLLASDIRPSIVQNLEKRLSQAGIRNYRSKVIDLSDINALAKKLGTEKFDLVICDAPCSGSGTWSRTPEQLAFFTETEIERYSKLQQAIVQNVSRYLKPGGFLLYITCSVFARENEEVVNAAVSHCSFTIVQSGLLKGYTNKADTMFAALLQLVTD